MSTKPAHAASQYEALEICISEGLYVHGTPRKEPPANPGGAISWGVSRSCFTFWHQAEGAGLTLMDAVNDFLRKERDGELEAARQERGRQAAWAAEPCGHGFTRAEAFGGRCAICK